MSGYTRLFSSILASSIWSEPDNVRIVWITMLAMSDKYGIVSASIVGLAHQARKSIPDTEAALAVLLAPDPHSKNPANEGRRVETIPATGWRVLNYEAYRNGLSDDPESVANRERVKKWREKHRDTAAGNAEKRYGNVTLHYPVAGVGVVDVIEGESAEIGGGAKTGGKGHPTPKPPKEQKSAYGELHCVKLTDAEYQKLLAKHGPDTLNRGIEILDGYIASKGARYASHYAVMKDDGWVWKRLAEIAPGAVSTIPGYVPMSNEEADRLVRGEQLDNAYEATE